jgi:hypothetical protein
MKPTTRKPLTAAQQAARDERKAKTRTIAKKVSAMSPVERANILQSCGAIVTVEGRALSLHNTPMLIFQRPGVSVVGGFRQWQTAGRCVMKGQKGLSILIPMGAKRENAETGETSIDADGKHFASATVFDISQTREIEAPEQDEDLAACAASPTGLPGVCSESPDTTQRDTAPAQVEFCLSC